MERPRFIPSKEVGIRVAEGAARVIVAVGAVSAGENILTGQNILDAVNNTPTSRVAYAENLHQEQPVPPEVKKIEDGAHAVFTGLDNHSKKINEAFEPVVTRVWAGAERFPQDYPDLTRFGVISSALIILWGITRVPRRAIGQGVGRAFRFIFG